jgi:hypothetical protein
VLARLDAAVDLAPALADPLRQATVELREALARVAADPHHPAVVAGARDLALDLAYALAAALLLEHAAWGDQLAAVAARLWMRRWLAGREIAAQAHSHADALCVG